jgi:hypothetical protein
VAIKYGFILAIAITITSPITSQLPLKNLTKPFSYTLGLRLGLGLGLGLETDINNDGVVTIMKAATEILIKTDR